MRFTTEWIHRHVRSSRRIVSWDVRRCPAYGPRTVIPLIAILLSPAAWGHEPLFPFVVSHDAPDNVTNVAGWIERPAGRHGFVRAEKDHFVTDAGPIRFWGTNLCFEACFPTHEQAERLAARLARFGVNCARLHHMDSRAIWGDSPNHLTIDPRRLERLDYLVHQLKRHGIYVNVNLHVSRWFDEAEGFPARRGRPEYDKGLDNFEPRMIELQEKYARDLLTHVNPYTGNAYTDEPAVAMVEINNENALLAVWAWNQLDDLPEPYATTYRRLWNEWLRAKYGTTERLLAAWNVRQKALGTEMLENGDFSKRPSVGWQMERDERTVVDWSTSQGGPGGAKRLRVVVSREGTVSWRPQFSQSGFSLRRGEPYTLSLWLKADQPRPMQINCMMAHAPWQNLGLSVQTQVGPRWRHEEFVFTASADDPNARITFTGLKPGVHELALVSLRPGGTLGPKEDETLEAETIPVVRHGRPGVVDAARRDFVDFLWDTESTYWRRMYRFLKTNLGVKSLVSGTQLSYSPPSIQARLDYLDAHAYFEHPDFPGRPWDPADWTIGNVALVNDVGGTLAGLAVRRVAGRPFTVTEYNHPAPNEYAAEGFPMIAAFGAFQRWNGVFSFTYSHDTDFEPRRITGFFDIKGDTAKLVHMPACAAMFPRGDVSPAKRLVTVEATADQQRKLLYKSLTPWTLTAAGFGLDPRMALVDRVAMRLNETKDATSDSTTLMPETAENQRVFVSDTDQLRWDVSTKRGGYFTVDSPRVKLFTGFVRGRIFALGDVRLAIGETRLDWATVSMVVIQGRGFDHPGRVLLAATGLVRNQDMRPQRLDNNRITLGNHWGSEPVLCEGVPAEVGLPVAVERVRCFALDGSGRRKETVEVTSREGRACLTLGPRYKTVWYEIEIR
ncbi:MAG TPA: carbohydrate binding domain-containing protein [Thermoguttaceae bacterium]|nr:carbohydrate binding domain-containing protein [Thermoguttaceae bacterium]